MGSPRRQSNTEILLDKALQGAGEAGAELEKVVVSELKMPQGWQLCHQR
jgi:multimeric flavodoxin WrbA